MYDLLLRGGHVIDAANSVDRLLDVALAAGRVAAVAEDIPSAQATKVINVTGKLVVPGLVDLHTHVYAGVSRLGIDADRYCLANGTTTLLDAGSAGALNIDGFRRFIVEPARTRIRALLNISSVGMPSMDASIVELGWLPLADVKAAVEAIEANRDLVLGLKARMSEFIVRENGIEPLYRTLDAAEQAGVPVMVHIGATPIPVCEVLDLLRPGDIVTHTYTAFGGLEYLEDGKSWRQYPFTSKGNGLTILDADGCVIPEAWAARERGVIMDVGHGMGSFSFQVCAAAIAQGFKPDTIGSDLHQGSVHGPAYDLPTVMSRFLSLGMTLPEIIAASTIRPAQVLGLAGEIGTLEPGAAGDVAVFDLLKGRFEYRDAAGQSLWGDRKLIPHLTVRAGEVVQEVGGGSG